MDLPEQVIEENKKLREDNARLTAEVQAMDADIQKLKSAIFQIMDMFNLLNPEKTGIDEKYWPTDGSVGENPLGNAISGFMELGVEWANANNFLKKKSERDRLNDELKKRFAFIWDIKDIYNRLAKYHGQQTIEIADSKPADSKLKLIP
jgi:hypothetical protein